MIWNFCESYVYGKKKRVRFLSVGKQKKSEKLELVHIDVWGLGQVQSLAGSHYYVTFIDDPTRKTWVALDRNLMCLILLRSGNLLLRMRQEKGLNVSDLIMEASTTARSLTVIVHTMGFAKRR